MAGDAVKRPGNRRDHRKGHPKDGYPRHGPSYKSKESSTDKSKTKRHLGEEEDDLKSWKDTSCSPEFYIFTFVILLLINLLLGYIAISLYSLEYRQTTVREKERGFTFEVNRRAMLIMSDNLDCSLYMKHLTMTKMDLRLVVIGGLQCLAINEPHSVAADGSISLFFHFKQDRNSIAKNLEGEPARRECVMGSMANNRCKLSSFPVVRTSAAKVDSVPFAWVHKEMKAYWLLDQDFFKDNKELLYRKLARFSPTKIDPEMPKPTRIFRVSGLFEKMLKFKKKDPNLKQMPIRKYTDLFNTTEKLRRKDKLVVTPNVANHVSGYMDESSAGAAANPLIDFPAKLRLRAPPGKNQLIKYIYYPNGPTHSLISAFVVKTVYNWYIEYIPADETISEAMLLAMVMKAQKLAYHFLIHSREWIGGSSIGVSMMARTGIAVKYLVEGLPNNLLAPLRQSPDRSASIVVWQKGDKEELHVVGTSLPRLFDSETINGQNKSKEFSRFSLEAHKSVPFSSHASLVIMEELHNDHGTQHPQIVAACSGSVRNAEAVATAILYQMILKHRPGKATWLGSIYYDVRDGKFYCDYEGVKSDYRRYSKHVEKVYKEAQELAGISCDRIPEDDVIAQDRMLMLATRLGTEQHNEKKKSVMNQNPYITGAMDPRIEEYNYPVGY